jgi:hypothetical protein
MFYIALVVTKSGNPVHYTGISSCYDRSPGSGLSLTEEFAEVLDSVFKLLVTFVEDLVPGFAGVGFSVLIYRSG